MVVPIPGPLSPKKEAMILVKSLGVGVIPFISMLLIIIFGYVFFGFWWTLLIVAAWIVIQAIVVFLVLYYWLAPNDIIWGYVLEGTAKIVLRFGGFKKTLLNWHGRYLNDYGEITPGFKKGQGVLEWIFSRFNLGGLRFIGIPLVDKVMYYNYQWISIDGEMVKMHLERVKNDIFVQRANYYVSLGLRTFLNDRGETVEEEDVKSAAEDNENLPLLVKAACTAGVLNPRASFLDNNIWLSIVNAILKGVLRGRISQKSYKELIQVKDSLGNQILEYMSTEGSMRYLKQEKLDIDLSGYFKELEDRYKKERKEKEERRKKEGKDSELEEEKPDFDSMPITDYLRLLVGIVIYKFDILDITPGEKWRELTLRETVAKREKDVIKIETEAKAFNITGIADANAQATRVTQEMNANMIKVTAAANAEAIEMVGVANSIQQAETTAGSIIRAFLKKLGVTYEITDSSGQICKVISQEEITELRKENPEVWRACEREIMTKIKIDNKVYVQVEGTEGSDQSMNSLTGFLALSNYFQENNVFGGNKK